MSSKAVSSSPSNHAVAESSGVRLPNFRLILVRPKFAGNIGACARLAANFGVSDIHVVAPECPSDWRSSEQVQAFATGSSTEQLRDFAEHATLENALGDCTRALAFTRRPRHDHPLDLLFSDALLNPGEPAQNPHQVPWPKVEERVALVFGNEKTGLLESEINLCTQCVRIATSDELGSMNLSHAVAVVLGRLYERAEKLQTHLGPEPGSSETEEGTRPAQLHEMQGLWTHWHEALIHLGFTEAGNPERMLRRIRTLQAPLPWQRRDVQLIRGILTRILKRIPR